MGHAACVIERWASSIELPAHIPSPSGASLLMRAIRADHFLAFLGAATERVYRSDAAGTLASARLLAPACAEVDGA